MWLFLLRIRTTQWMHNEAIIFLSNQSKLWLSIDVLIHCTWSTWTRSVYLYLPNVDTEIIETPLESDNLRKCSTVNTKIHYKIIDFKFNKRVYWDFIGEFMALAHFDIFNILLNEFMCVSGGLTVHLISIYFIRKEHKYSQINHADFGFCRSFNIINTH